MKLHIVYNKKQMQWQVKLGRLAIFASDSYEIVNDFKLQHTADADQERLYARKVGD